MRYKFRLSRKKVWIITLSVTFSVLFYGYSLIAMFPFTFFFSKKRNKKLSTKEIVASTLCSCRKNACTRSGTCLAVRFTAVLRVLRTALS